MKAIAYINGSHVRKFNKCAFAGQIIMEEDVFDVSGATDKEEICCMQIIGACLKAAEITIKKAMDLGIKELEIITNLNAVEDFTFGYCKPKQKGTIDYVNFIDSTEGVIELDMRRPNCKLEEKKLAEVLINARKALNN